MDFFEKPTIQSCAYSVLYSEKDWFFFFFLYLYINKAPQLLGLCCCKLYILHICVTDKISLFSIMARFPFSIITWN